MNATLRNADVEQLRFWAVQNKDAANELRRRNGKHTKGETMTTLTIGDLKKHRGEIRGWVNIFGDDGEYFKLAKADVLRQIGADVPQSCDGLADSTPLSATCEIRDGVLYID